MKKRWGQMALLFAIIAFVLERAFSSSLSVTSSFTTSQTVFQLILIGVESLSFGIGISFALYGKEIINKMIEYKKRQGYLLYGSIIWLLAAWLPYSTLLTATGTSNVNEFLTLSYFFQLSLIISGLIVAYFFINPLLSSEK